MRFKKLRKTCLLIGGVASVAMAIFHFFLPHVFGWARFVSHIPAPIRWGLFSLNVFFSSLLLWGGILTIITALKYQESNLLSYSIFIGMGCFWIINASYQIVFPFPAATWRWVLLAFAVTMAGLYLFAIYLSHSKSLIEGASHNSLTPTRA
jgi:hypothetical protein